MGSSGRVHCEVAADRQQRDVRFVVAADEGHVAEYSCRTRVIDLRTVLELDDVAGRLVARVHAFLLGLRIGVDQFRAVLGVHHGHSDAVAQRLGRPAPIEADQAFVGDPAEFGEAVSHVSIEGDLGALHLGSLGRVADMIAVPVGD
jgi:hypothetical protein